MNTNRDSGANYSINNYLLAEKKREKSPKYILMPRASIKSVLNSILMVWCTYTWNLIQKKVVKSNWNVTGSWELLEPAVPD